MWVGGYGREVGHGHGGGRARGGFGGEGGDPLRGTDRRVFVQKKEEAARKAGLEEVEVENGRLAIRAVDEGEDAFAAGAFAKAKVDGLGGVMEGDFSDVREAV